MMRPGLSPMPRRSPLPSLPARAWRLLAGYALCQLGTGLTQPFLIVYLHQARGLPLATAGLTLGVSAAASLLAAPFGGLADRQAGRVAVGGLLLAAGGAAGFVAVRGLAGALLAAGALGLGTATSWNGISTLYAAAVPPARRADIFGLNYALQNVGVGLGAALGGAIVDVRSVPSFAHLFLGDAASDLTLVALLVAWGETRRPKTASPWEPSVRASADRGRTARWRVVLADRALLGATALSTLLIVAGPGQLDAAFPAWAIGPGQASARTVGLAFAANTATVALAQLGILRLLRGRRRLRATAAAAFAFGLAWVLLIATATLGPAATGGGLILAAALVGLGETLLAPSLPALVNDLAPAGLRGRYNAVYNLSWRVGPLVAPILAGALLARGLDRTLFVGLAASCALGAVCALGLERQLPPALNANPVDADAG